MSFDTERIEFIFGYKNILLRTAFVQEGCQQKWTCPLCSAIISKCFDELICIMEEKMKKQCPVCGEDIEETQMMCPNCQQEESNGEEVYPEFSFEEESVDESQEEKDGEEDGDKEQSGKLNDKSIKTRIQKLFNKKILDRINYKIVALVGCCLSVVLSVAIIIITTQSDKSEVDHSKEVFEKSLKALYTDGDLMKFLDCGYEEEVSVLEQSHIIEKLKQQVKEMRGDYMYTFEIEDYDEVDEEYIEETVDKYKDTYGIDISIDEIVEAEVELADNSGRKVVEHDQNYYAMKVDGKWYVMNVFDIVTRIENYNK